MIDVALRYAYRVHWSPEDEMFVGTVAELPSLSWLADDQVGALAGIVQAVREVVADLAATGERVPEALAGRRYSGKFLVRIPPEEHHRLAVAAAEQKISLNRLAASRLARA